MYYHASPIKGITRLEPRVSNHGIPLVYFSMKREMELLTDNTEKTKAFYRSVGFTASDDMGCVAFIRM